MYKERNKTRGMGRGGIFRSISFIMLFLMLAGSLAGIGSLLFKNTSVLDEAGTGGNVVTAGITGSGNSANDPYVITTKQDLIDFANPSNAATYWRANSFAKLAADIDWGGQNGGNFSMIGNATTPYQGTFDGNRHVIKNIYVSTTANAGIFGVIAGTVTIKNLGNLYGEIRCTSTATSGLGIGGIVGLVASGSTALISDCFNTGLVKLAGADALIENGTGGILGGLAGSGSKIEVIRCFNTGNVQTTDRYGHAGGIFAHNNNTGPHAKIYVAECFNTGKIEQTGTISYRFIGGIFGHFDTHISGGVNSSVVNCYNLGATTGGGIGAGTGGNSYVQNVNNCYNAGQAATHGISSGGINNCTNCFNDKGKQITQGYGINLDTTQMTSNDVLEKLSTATDKGMKELLSDNGAGKWIKRPNDTTSDTELSKRYYPELASMANHEWKVFRDYSKASVVASGFVDPGYKPNEKPVCNSNTTVEVPSIGNGT